MVGQDVVGVGDLPYLSTYHPDLSPASIRLALLSRGVRFDSARPLRYLELGFGQGLSLNVHAAATPGQFWGNDFVEAHVARAQALANSSGAPVRVLPDSFAQLAAGVDLPQFDIVVAHGVWSWIADADRAAIVSLLRRRLAPGGVFYVSYNTTAAWARLTYLRQLMHLHAAESARRGASSEASAARAVEFARQLAAAGAKYFKANPAVAAELQAATQRRTSYLAHEFFSSDWRLFTIAEAADMLAPAGLDYAASAVLLSHNDALTLTEEGRAILAAQPTALLQETVRECFLNQEFRQDIFIKDDGGRLSDEERVERFRGQAFALTVPAAGLPTTASGPLGEIDLEAQGCTPLMASLAADGYAPKTVAQLERRLGLGPEEVIRRLLLLAGVARVRAAQDAQAQQAVADQCARLNARLLSEPVADQEVSPLASPVLGSGALVSRFGKLFLAARAAGAQTSREWADFAVERLAAVGERRDGAAMAQAAEAFAASRLPVLRGLRVA